MRFTPVGPAGAYLVELEPREDERGMFARIWCQEEFAAHELDCSLAQCSISRNIHAGTLRGLHFQRPPHEETKLVRCVRGAIYDVIVDLRPDSSTRGEWFGVDLHDREGAALYVPKGIAHGFQTLVDDTDVVYMISEPYMAEAAAGVRWDDPIFGIHWPEAMRTMSERDRSWPDFSFETS